MLINLLIYLFFSVGYCSAAAAEKRQADEPLSSAAEEPRKKKIEGDVPSDVVAEIVEVTSDPKKMLGPDVSMFFSITNCAVQQTDFMAFILNLCYLLLLLSFINFLCLLQTVCLLALGLCLFFCIFSWFFVHHCQSVVQLPGKSRL